MKILYIIQKWGDGEPTAGVRFFGGSNSRALVFGLRKWGRDHAERFTSPMWKWLSLIHTYPNHDTFWWKQNWSMFLQILQPAMAILVGHQQKASSRLGGWRYQAPSSHRSLSLLLHLVQGVQTIYQPHWDVSGILQVHCVKTQDGCIKKNVQWPQKKFNHWVSWSLQLPIHNPDLPKVVYTPFKWGCLEYLVAMPRCCRAKVTDHSCGSPAGCGVTWWKTGCRWCLGQCSPWTSSLRRSKSEMGVVDGSGRSRPWQQWRSHLQKWRNMDGILGYSWISHEVRIYCTYFGDVGALW